MPEASSLPVTRHSSLVTQIQFVMRFFLLFLGLLLALAGCRCDEPLMIDLGPIPDSILNQVSYQNGKAYPFRHSGGMVIDFASQRTSHDEYTWCDHCCKYLYKYQLNETILHPDYPVFDFRVVLSSEDTLNYSHVIWIGHSLFYLPGYTNPPVDYGYSDSIQLNEKWFYGVYSMKNSNEPISEKGSIYPDSLYYNFQSGILKIVMTNGEFYQKYE